MFRTVLNASGTKAECFIGPAQVAMICRKEGYWVATDPLGNMILKTPHTALIHHHEPGYRPTKIKLTTPIAQVINQIRQEIRL